MLRSIKNEFVYKVELILSISSSMVAHIAQSLWKIYRMKILRQIQLLHNKNGINLAAKHEYSTTTKILIGLSWNESTTTQNCVNKTYSSSTDYTLYSPSSPFLLSFFLSLWLSIRFFFVRSIWLRKISLQ